MFVNSITNIETRIGYNEGLVVQDKDLAIELKSPIYSVSMGILKFVQNKYNDKTIQIESNSLLFSFLKKIFS